MLPASAVAIRIVVQRPETRLTVRINVGWRGCAATAAGPHAFLVNAVGRVKVKPLSAGAFDGCADKVLRRRRVLGVVAAHTVGRVEEANEGRAVADTAVKRNFALGMQRLIERQRLVEPIAIVGHATAVELHARIAAKRVAADLTPALSAGKVRARAVAEIESRTNVGADVGIAVIQLVPTRV